MKDYFIIKPSVLYEGFYQLRYNHDAYTFPMGKRGGSYQVVAPRLLNMSLANFYRMLRDCFGAIIIGKEGLYSTPLFKKSQLEGLKPLIELLNARMDLVVNLKNNPLPKPIEEIFFDEYQL